jgi:hypothetical protein
MIESLLSGGVVGLVGSIASNVFGYFKNKQEHQQNIELKKIEIVSNKNDHAYAMEQIKAEAGYKTQQLMVEAESELSVSAYKALSDSYITDATYAGDSRLLIIAEFIKKITRPVLTYVLVFLTTGIYFKSDGDIQDDIARAVVAMTATVVSWWFADRQIAKQIGKRIL